MNKSLLQPSAASMRGSLHCVQGPQFQVRGFTLIELLLAMAIVTLLAAIGFTGGSWAMKKAKINKAKAQIGIMEAAIGTYYSDFAEYPPGDGSKQSSLSLFNALYAEPANNGEKVYLGELNPDVDSQFKIDNRLILDPWKNPYRYLRALDETGNQASTAYNPDYDLWSLGPDGQGRGGGGGEQETEDDVSNW